MSPLLIHVIVTGALGLLVRRFLPAEKHAQTRLWVAVATSVVLLACWQLFALGVTLILAGLTWFCIQQARAAAPDHRGRWVTGGVVLLVAALVGFKYTPWLATGASAVGPAWAQNWIVPLGLSFTVFRLIGVLLDSVRLQSAVSGPQFLLLALFFPCFRSGPIETIQSLRPLTADDAHHDVRSALERIFFGVCRKAVLADTLHALVIGPWVAQGIPALSPTQSVLLPFLFGLHVYLDFSGYTDIAVGTAALFGFRVSENFDRPYLSRNLVEFWRRWHISLSEWIRTRLFMKMVGRRSPEWHLYGATVVAMALCGLWHGAGLNFLVWGLWHGFGLVAVHLFSKAQRRSDWVREMGRLPGVTALSVAVTFLYVTAGWIVFFLPVGDAWLLAKQILSAGPWSQPDGLIVAGCIVALVLAGLLSYRPRMAWSTWPYLLRNSSICVLGAIVVYMLLFRQTGMQEFIYAQF